MLRINEKLDMQSIIAEKVGTPPVVAPETRILQWVGEPDAVPVTGRDLLLAVDISGSMKTDDLTRGGRRATRLEVVRNVDGVFDVERVTA